MVTSEELNTTLPTLLSQYCNDSGADARYWHKGGTKWGIKFYFDELARDQNYERQAEAHHLGIAPQLGDKVEWDIDGSHVYGFITQHIRVAFWLPDEEKQDARKLLDETISTYDDDTRRRLYQDLHNKNWGIDDDGKPLIIDFSRQTSNDYSNDYSDGSCDCTCCRLERGESITPSPECVELPE